MLVLPIESRPLLVLGAPVAQFKDKDKTIAVTDRDTGAAMVEVTVALTVEGGQPQVLRVRIPQPAVPANLSAGQLVKAAGLTLMAGEKNGRAWQMFRASALTAVKP